MEKKKERGKPLSKEQKDILGKDYVKNNVTFTPEQILEFYELFQLYADYTTKRVDLVDILATAQTLDLSKKYKMVYRILNQIYEEQKLQAQQDENQTQLFDFETFIRKLTESLGNTYTTEGRSALFTLLDYEQQGQVNNQMLVQAAKDLQHELTLEEATEIVENVGGFGKEAFDFDKFDKFIERKLERQKNLQN